MTSRVKFYGSDVDLAALKADMEIHGVKEYEGNFIRATDPATVAAAGGISYVIASEIGSAVKHYLTNRGKRMVTRETHGEKITIKGDFSAEEIERLLKIPYGLDIENDVAPLPEPSNKESEMGFHVGRDKPQ